MSETVSPLIQQYLEIKANYKEELVFFQVGDFYELFFEDAKIAANILSITLTKRGVYKSENIPLCGIPVHMLEQYYPKLIKKGYIVIICNQTEPAQTGKLVNRAVVDIITPSTILSDDIYENIYSLFITITNNFIVTFWFEFSQQEIVYSIYQNSTEGIVFFKSTFEKYKPKEIITKKETLLFLYEILPYKKSIKGFEFINQNIEIQSFLKKYNLNYIFEDISILFLSYLSRYFENLVTNNCLIIKEDLLNNYLFLDQATIKYLECTNNLENNSKENTLYELLDKTKTKMGSRLLKKWILYPLKDKLLIEKRQKNISFFIEYKSIKKEIQSFLESFGDIEKLFQRIRLSKIREKDYISLYHFQNNYTSLKNYINTINNSILNTYINFSIPETILNLIKDTININSIFIIDNTQTVINPNCNNTLLEKYNLITNQESEIDKFCQNERDLKGIPDLNIKKTPLYQYVFELSKIKEKQYTIPKEYIRVQTLTQKERYTSIPLQELSHNIIYAHQEYKKIEDMIKNSLINKINGMIQLFFSFIDSISILDIYLALSDCAINYHWHKPNILDKGMPLKIISGKHPIISQKFFHYIANSLILDTNKKTCIITGPNMGGKSTFMKQNALLILLAQIGSYIPSIESDIPIMEKILTRIGASDNLHQGKSTFFTELEEINTILVNANQYSFIIIDEIGRGTSTHDGIALAASIIEYLIIKKPFLLCSTHYHELNSLINNDTILWYHMDAVIKNDIISFLYTIIPGKADNSMGIALAKKIGLPIEITKKAELYFNTLKHTLNNTHINQNNSKEQKIINHNTSSTQNNNINNIDEKKYKNYHTLLKEIFYDKNMDDLSPKEAYIVLEKFYTIYKK